MSPRSASSYEGLKLCTMSTSTRGMKGSASSYEGLKPRRFRGKEEKPVGSASSYEGLKLNTECAMQGMHMPFSKFL